MFRKRDASTGRDHKVVQPTHINQCQCLFEPAGSHLFRAAGVSDTRGVIVKIMFLDSLSALPV